MSETAKHPTESKAGHTPGPWHSVHKGVVLDSSGEMVGIVSVCSRSDREAYANSRLIVAAPELLAALRAAQSALISYQYGNSDSSLAKEVADHLAALIAKAEGR